MAWKVVWTETAFNDLEEVADYIAKDSPYYAAGSGAQRPPYSPSSSGSI